VEITNSADGTLPQQIVNYAYDCCVKNNKWDEVYCVFDRDDHLNFDNAIKSANAKNNKISNDQGQKIKFYAIPSVPCFELWLMLHFEAKSATCDRFDLFEEIRKYIPGYDKGYKATYEKTRNCLDEAIKNAAQLSENGSDFEITNPYTAVYIVMEKLKMLANR
jgi:hypothetical protein